MKDQDNDGSVSQMSAEYTTSRVATGESTCDVMQHAYREMLRPHMIVVILTTSACIVGVFVVVGLMGTYEGLTPLERLVFGAVYTMAGWPICYSMTVVALYFLRFRALHEIAAALTLLALFEAFPCSTIAYTVKSLVDSQPQQGFLDLYLLVATITIACSLFFLYVVYQRLSRSTAPGTVTPGTSSGTAAAEQEVDDTAELAVRPVPEQSGAESENEPASGDDEEPPDREPPEEGEAEQPLPSAPPAESNGGTSTAPATATSTSDPPDAISTPATPPNPNAAPAPRAELAPRLAGPRNGFSAQTARKPAAILTMLPANVGTDVVYLKSEDHYIDVHTTAGSSLVKMRFSDAVADLGDRGIKVHRSYWVATSHVQRLVRNGKRTQIRLTGGHQVPVSVTHLPIVRAAVGR